MADNVFFPSRRLALTGGGFFVYCRDFRPAGPVKTNNKVRQRFDDMFAVVRTGGKQYTVAKDDVLTIEKVVGEAGGTLELKDVLLVGGETVKTGAPVVEGAVVTAEIVEQGKGEKVVAFKKRRRKDTHRKRGHRQPFTKIKITDITA
jgi:large subunit ribosomal protein L21